MNESVCYLKLEHLKLGLMYCAKTNLLANAFKPSAINAILILKLVHSTHIEIQRQPTATNSHTPDEFCRWKCLLSTNHSQLLLSYSERQINSFSFSLLLTPSEATQ